MSSGDKNIFERLSNIPEGYKQNYKPTKWDNKSNKETSKNGSLTKQRSQRIKLPPENKKELRTHKTHNTWWPIQTTHIYINHKLTGKDTKYLKSIGCKQR